MYYFAGSYDVAVIGAGHAGVEAALAAASGLPTVAGALLGCFLGSLGDVWVSVLLAFAAGAMVFVSAYELYPNATEICGKALAAFAALAGIAVTVLIL